MHHHHHLLPLLLLLLAHHSHASLDLQFGFALVPGTNATSFTVHKLSFLTNSKYCNPDGSDYFGTVNVTVSNKRCVDWPSVEIENFPLAGLELGAYCRNPDGSAAPWCYTSETEWEFCDVSKYLVPVDLRLTNRNSFSATLFNLNVSVSGKYCLDGAICQLNRTRADIGCYVSTCNSTNPSECSGSDRVFESCDVHLCCTDCKTTSTLTDVDGELSETFTTSKHRLLSGYYRTTFLDSNGQKTSGVIGVVHDGAAALVEWPADVSVGDFVVPANPKEVTGKFTLKLFDSYGDGWTGNTLSIQDCSGNQWYSTTLTTGLESTIDVDLTLPSSEFQIVVGGGYFENEVSWSLISPFGSFSGGCPVTVSTLCPAVDDGCPAATPTPAVTYPLPIDIDTSGLESGIFVSPLGNDDTNNGSIQFPVRTVSRAVALLDNLEGLKTKVVHMLPGVHNVSKCETVSVSQGTEQCLTLVLQDTYGDGWNNAQLTIWSCDEAIPQIVEGPFTLASGSSESKKICFPYNRGFKVTITSGAYPGEVQWYLLLPSTVVYAFGSADSQLEVGCPAPVSAQVTVSNRWLPGSLLAILPCNSGVDRSSVSDIIDNALATVWVDAKSTNTTSNTGSQVLLSKIVGGFETVEVIPAQLLKAIQELVQRGVLPNSTDGVLEWTLTHPDVTTITGVGNSSVGCGVGQGSNHSVTAATPTANSFLEFEMTDTYGDGWDDAVASLLDCNGNLLFQATLVTGKGGTAYFDVGNLPLYIDASVMDQVLAGRFVFYVSLAQYAREVYWSLVFRLDTQITVTDSATNTSTTVDVTPFLGNSLPLFRGSSPSFVNTCFDPPLAVVNSEYTSQPTSTVPDETPWQMIECAPGTSREFVFTLLDTTLAGWQDPSEFFQLRDCSGQVFVNVSLVDAAAPNPATTLATDQTPLAMICVREDTLLSGFQLDITTTKDLRWELSDRETGTKIQEGAATSFAYCTATHLCTLDPRVGNGVCDPSLNVAPCWDGGDCCEKTCFGPECKRRPKFCAEYELFINGIGNVTVQAADGERSSPYVKVSDSTTVHFSGITFDGISDSESAALIVGTSSARVTVSNCTFQSMTSTLATGISVDSSSVVISVSSTFKNMEAFIFASSILASDDSVAVVINSTFSHNFASIGGGSVTAISSSVLFLGCTVDHSVARIGGFVASVGESSEAYVFNTSAEHSVSTIGGAFVFARTSNLFMRDSVCTHNTGSFGGCLLLLDPVRVLIAGSTFEHNFADTGGAIGCVSESARISSVALGSSVLRNNSVSGNGGGFYGEACNLVASNTNFEDHTAAGSGGAIYIINGQMVVAGSEVKGNTAHGDGGGAYVELTASSSLFANPVLVVGSQFTANAAVNSYGGALAGKFERTAVVLLSGVFAHNRAMQGGAISITNANVTNNQQQFLVNQNTAENGGAIAIEAGHLDFQGAVFESNVASSFGGAIYSEGSVTLRSCSVINNNSTFGGGMVAMGDHVVLERTTVSGNIASSSGGGLRFDAATTRIQNCSISANVALSGDGGGIQTQIGSISIQNTIISYNRASRSGGGFWAVLTDTVLNFTKFDQNFAGVDGGAVATSTVGSSSEITNCEFDRNMAGSMGGALVASGSMHSITHSNFTNNLASSGGALSAVVSAFANFSSNILTGNTASRFGGALHIIDSRAIWADSLVELNTASLGGGITVVQSLETPIQFIRMRIVSNTAKEGAGMQFSDSYVSIIDSEITNNTANQCAGMVGTRIGMNMESTALSSNHAIAGRGGAGCFTQVFAMNVQNTNVTNNIAYTTAGGFAIKSAVDINTPKFESCNFENNYAGTSGGAMTLEISANIMQCAFNNNTAVVGDGGALFSSGFDIQINSSSFEWNKASAGCGGAVYADDVNPFLIYSVSMENNFAAVGGALCVSSGELQTRSCNFSHNIAIGAGGAIHVLGANAIAMNHSSLSNNTAQTGNGGALAIVNSAGIVVSDSLFSSNKAPKGSGGGLYFSASPDRVVTSTSFSKNEALFGTTQSASAHSLLLVSTINANPIVNSFIVGSLNITLLDEFGQQVTTENDATCHLTLNSVTVQLLGAQVAVFTAGSTSFSDLMFLNGCGETHTLTFTSSLENVTSASISLYVECEQETFSYLGALIVVSIFVAIDLVLMFVIYANRLAPIIVRSSPPFCLLQLSGNIIFLVGIIPYISSSSSVSCGIAISLFALGFTLAYGSLLLKTWRVMKLFGNKSLSRLILPNSFLFGWLSVFLAVDVILLGVEFGINNPGPDVVLLKSSNKQFDVCGTSLTSPPMIILVVLKVLMLVYGVVLSWKVSRLFRKDQTMESKKDFNESKYIGYCLNNTVLFLAVLIPVVLALGDTQWKLRLGLVVVMATATSQFNALILFPPKVSKLYRSFASLSSSGGGEASRSKRLRSLFNPAVVAPTTDASPPLQMKTVNMRSNYEDDPSRSGPRAKGNSGAS